MPRDKCTSTGIFASLGESEGGEWRGKRLIFAGPRDAWSGMMNRLHVTGGLLIMAILSVEMRCLSDVVLRERRDERGSRGRAGISVNLAAKWRVWHVVSVWRSQRDTSPLHLLSAHFDEAHKRAQLTPRDDEWNVWEHLESDIYTFLTLTKRKRATHNLGGKRRLWQQEGVRWRRGESIFKLFLKTHKQT